MGILIVKVLHVALAAGWFGVGLSVPGDVRRTIALGPPHLGPLHARLLRTGMIARISAITTILSGIALVLMMGGFGTVQHRFHAAIALAVVTAGVGITMGKLAEKIVAAGENASPETLSPYAKKIAALSGIHHLLWLTILVLMIVPLF